MSKEEDLLNNNNQKEKEKEVKDESFSNSKKNNNLNQDEIIDINLYNQVSSTLFNSLSNPIVRNEIKVNESILKYLELQISNLFYLEVELTKELDGKKNAKEFLQLTADITNLSLSINKSPKKNRIEILEDRNLLVVTIINSCKGIERESLERLRTIDNDAFKSLNNQVSALVDFALETENHQTKEHQENLNQEEQLNNLNNNQTNNLNNNNFKNLANNANNLTKLGVLPEHPASNPKFYPYLTKPTVILKLKKILSGALIFSLLFIVITVITSTFVKGSLLIDKTKDPIQFVLSQTNNWLILVMTVVLYASFVYIFVKPARLIREKYHISYFMLGLLLFWLIITISFFLWQITDNYYSNLFQGMVKDAVNLNEKVVSDLKNLPNFNIFRIFSIVTAGICIVPLLLVIVLMLINPRLDRNKVMRANTEYQNAISAALNGQRYQIDQSLFDKDDEKEHKKKSRKAHFSGRF